MKNKPIGDVTLEEIINMMKKRKILYTFCIPINRATFFIDNYFSLVIIYKSNIIIKTFFLYFCDEII
jgi:hypothetical protein